MNKFVGNLIGTCILVLVGCSAVAAGFHIVLVGLAFGAGVAIVATLFPACQFNPQLTLAKLVSGEVTGRDFWSSITGQLLGAFLASLAMVWHFGAKFGIGEALPAAGLSYWLVFLYEASGTTLLGGAALSGRKPHEVGLALGIPVAMFGNITGGAFNFARWFGPALVLVIYGVLPIGTFFELAGVYGFAQLTGAAVAWLLVGFGIVPEN